MAHRERQRLWGGLDAKRPISILCGKGDPVTSICEGVLGALALVHLRLRKARRARIAAHDRHALRIAHHIVDVGKAVRRQSLDRVDYAFGAALAVQAYDLRGWRQARGLIGGKGMKWMFGVYQ